jgi:hypothetical protein
MRIAIIGAGTVGRTLGRGWAAAGHDVIYGVRDLAGDTALALAAEGAVAALPREAAQASDVVVLATPWPATEAAVTALGDLGGRPLLDATNPIGPGLTLTVGHTASGGEQVQAWAPGARVVKVLNTTGAENMADPRYGSERATMFLCGDDAAARSVAARLVEELGFEAVAAGPLANARLLEPLALLWIDLALRQGLGRGIAFRLMQRG